METSFCTYFKALACPETEILSYFMWGINRARNICCVKVCVLVFKVLISARLLVLSTQYRINCGWQLISEA